MQLREKFVHPQSDDTANTLMQGVV
jgi:hypothetical protein